MTTEYFIIELYCQVGEIMQGISKHSQAKLYPGKVVTLEILFALNAEHERFSAD